MKTSQYVDRNKTDELLMKAAMIFANCENTPEGRAEAKRQEREILLEIAMIDPELGKTLLPDETDE